MSSSQLSTRPDGGVVDVSIVSVPCDPGSVPGLLDDISQMRDNCDVSTDRGVRLELLSKARALVQALETPRETMLKHCGAQVRGLCDMCGRVRHADGSRPPASLLLPSELKLDSLKKCLGSKGVPKPQRHLPRPSGLMWMPCASQRDPKLQGNANWHRPNPKTRCRHGLHRGNGPR